MMLFSFYESICRKRFLKVLFGVSCKKSECLDFVLIKQVSAHKREDAKLSSSLFKLKRQQITLADIWLLVFSSQSLSTMKRTYFINYVTLFLSTIFSHLKKKCLATLYKPFIIQHCLSKTLKTVLKTSLLHYVVNFALALKIK